MSAGAITAGEAYVSITCDNSELVAGLRESSASIQATARNVAAMEDALIVNVGVEGVGALESALARIEGAVKRTGTEMAASFAIAAEAAGTVFQKLKNAVLGAASAFGEFGDSFDKMAGRTGVSATTLSEYAHAASMCGADISNVEGALKGMSRYLDDAATKGGDAKAAFDRLGLSATELLIASPERQFETIAAAIARIEEPTERAALAMKIFGDDGQKLLPLFSSGADGLQAMKEEARALGVSLSGDAAASAAAYVDATTRLQTAIQGAGLAFAELFAPALTKAVACLAEAVSGVSRLAREFPGLATAITLAVASVGALGAATVAFSWSAAPYAKSYYWRVERSDGGLVAEFKASSLGANWTAAEALEAFASGWSPFRPGAGGGAENGWGGNVDGSSPDSTAGPIGGAIDRAAREKVEALAAELEKAARERIDAVAGELEKTARTKAEALAAEVEEAARTKLDELSLAVETSATAKVASAVDGLKRRAGAALAAVGVWGAFAAGAWYWLVRLLAKCWGSAPKYRIVRDDGALEPAKASAPSPSAGSDRRGGDG